MDFERLCFLGFGLGAVVWARSRRAARVPRPVGTVTQLYVYPIKSCRGHAVSSPIITMCSAPQAVVIEVGEPHEEQRVRRSALESGRAPLRPSAIAATEPVPRAAPCASPELAASHDACARLRKRCAALCCVILESRRHWIPKNGAVTATSPGEKVPSTALLEVGRLDSGSQ